MPPQNKDKDYNPFAVNFRKLQTYNLKYIPLDEAVFFEYLMLLAQSFGYKQFYHSTAKISEEVGIKRTRIETLISKFTKAEIIDVEVKGFPKVKFFTVRIDKVVRMLPAIYQFVGNDKLYDEINKLYAEINKKYVETNLQEKLNISNNIKETKEVTKDKKGVDMASPYKYSISEVSDFLNKIENTYNTVRQNKEPGKYPKALLPFKKFVAPLANEALNEMGHKLLSDAWLVYVHKIVGGELKPKQILKYFFSKKDDTFDVIGSMADVHNTEYVYTNYKKE